MKQDERVKIVGEARDGTEALEEVAATNPDLLFLDIQMPRLNGAEEKYVRLHVEGRSYLHRETMNDLEERLDPSFFVRVHRGEIVNMYFIRELESLSHGDYQIVLKDSSRVPLGRTYRDQFLRRFAES